MLFRKNRPGEESGGLDDGGDEEVHESDRATHKGYSIVPRTKRLHNGNWIVRLTLEQARPEGNRRFDLPGPMLDYPSVDDAKRAGIEHAKRVLDGSPT